MQELIIDGKRFYSSRRTGQILGYTNDYVGKLCREQKLEAKMVGRSWYVSEESIQKFTEEILMEKEARNQELSKAMYNEYHSKQNAEDGIALLPSNVCVDEATVRSEETPVSGGFIFHPRRPFFSRELTAAYLVSSLFIALIVLLQIPEINDFAKKTVHGAKEFATVALPEINSHFNFEKEISLQLTASVQNSKKIPEETAKSILNSFEFALKNFTDLGQIGREGFLKTGKSLAHLNYFILNVGNFYIDTAKNVTEEFIAPLKIANEYYAPLFYEVANGYSNIGNATLHAPALAFEVTKKIGDFYIYSSDEVFALSGESFENGVGTLRLVAEKIGNKFASASASFAESINTKDISEVASVREFKNEEVLESEVKVLDSKGKSTSKKPYRSSKKELVTSGAFREGVEEVVSLYLGMADEVIGSYINVGNISIEGSKLAFGGLKGIGNFYINSTVGSFAQIGSGIGSGASKIKDSFQNSSPNLRNTASSYFSASNVSNKVFEAGEVVTGALRNIGNTTLGAVSLTFGTISEIGNFYIVSTVGTLAEVGEGFKNIKNIYAPLFIDTATAYIKIGEKTLALFDKSYDGISSIGNGVLYGLQGVAKIPTKIAFAEKNMQLASIGGFWDSVIDKISDPLVPLFLDPNNIDGTKFITTNIEVDREQQNNNETPFVSNTSSNTNKDTHTIVERLIAGSGVTANELALAMGAIRAEFISLNNKTRDYVVNTSSKQSEVIYKGINTTVAASAVDLSIITGSTITGSTFAGTADLTALTLGIINGPLQANAGVVTATTSIGVLYGGTGLTSAPSYGQLLVGNSSGGYTLTATSSLGITSGSNIGQAFEIDSNGILAPTTTISVLVNGNFYASSTALFGGRVTASEFTATSTAATSTFGGGLSAASSLYVLQNGNVGIGSASPASLFNVYSSDNASAQFTNSTTGITATDGFYVGADSLGAYLDNYENSPIYFMTNNDTKMIISAAGNVGIGTTSPYKKLSVSGEGFFEGLVTAPYFTSTSTTASIFPYASTTALTVSGSLVANNASSTITNLTMVNATSTNLYVSSGLKLNLTANSIPYAGINGVLTGDVNNLFYDQDNSRLGAGVSGNVVYIGNSAAFGGYSALDLQTSAGVGYGTIFADPNAGDTAVYLNNVNVAGTFDFYNNDANNIIYQLGTASSKLYYDASNHFDTSVSSAGLITLDAIGSGSAFNFSDNLGIGTTSPWATLAVNPVAGAAANQFVVGSSTATNFIIKNDGKVGIGTSSPSAKLFIQGNSDVQQLIVQGHSTQTNGILEVRSSDSLAQVALGKFSGGGGSLRLADPGQDMAAGGGSYEMYVGSDRAMYMTPAYAQRLYFGTASKPWYGLNFSNVGTFEGVPSDFRMTGVDGSGGYFGMTGFTGSSIAPNNTGSAYLLLSAGAITGKQSPIFNRQMSFVSFANDVDSSGAGGTVSAYKFDTASTSDKLTAVRHTDWATGGAITMSLTSTGNLGIGTTTPQYKLDIVGSSANAVVNSLALDNTNGGVGWGSKISFNQAGVEKGKIQMYYPDTTNSYSLLFGTLGAPTAMIINNSGSVGIGTTSPWRTLSVTGTVGFDGLTAAGATSDAICLSSTKEIVMNTGGVSCTVSSARFKHNIESLDAEKGLSFANLLRPVSFEYNGTNKSSLGFIAEEVNELDSRLVFYEQDGTTPRGVNYEAFAPILTKAIQELDIKVNEIISTSTEAFVESSLFTNILSAFESLGTKIENSVAWFKELFADKIHTRELCVGDSDTGEICLTKAQLQALMDKSGGGYTVTSGVSVVEDLEDTPSLGGSVAGTSTEPTIDTGTISTSTEAVTSGGGVTDTINTTDETNTNKSSTPSAPTTDTPVTDATVNDKTTETVPESATVDTPSEVIEETPPEEDTTSSETSNEESASSESTI